MTPHLPTTACVLMLAAIGCAPQAQEDEYELRTSLNAAMVSMYAVQAVDQAIIRQHTLFPYHFRAGTAELNGLGHRDIGVLTRYYGDGGGHLNVRRGDASDQLYAARVDAVLEAIARHGIDREQITTSDDLPGGDGLASSHVSVILEGNLGSPSEDGSADSSPWSLDQR